MCIPEKGYVEMKMFAGKHYGVYKAKEADFYTCYTKLSRSKRMTVTRRQQ